MSTKPLYQELNATFISLAKRIKEIEGLVNQNQELIKENRGSLKQNQLLSKENSQSVKG